MFELVVCAWGTRYVRRSQLYDVVSSVHERAAHCGVNKLKALINDSYIGVPEPVVRQGIPHT